VFNNFFAKSNNKGYLTLVSILLWIILITIYTYNDICFTNEVYSQNLSVKTGFSLTLDDPIIPVKSLFIFVCFSSV